LLVFEAAPTIVGLPCAERRARCPISPQRKNVALAKIILGRGPVTKSKKANHLLLGVLVASLVAVLSPPAQAQQAEPHTESFRAKIKAKYTEKRERFMHRVKDLYFAAGCKVLAGEAGIMPLTSADSYLAYIGEQTIIDTKDESARQAAARAGQELATKPGECDYFRRHPEAAEAARLAVAKAKR
jgi:hypothetical protein